MPVKIFFCYSHEDEELLNKLKAHLKPLQRQGLIDIWYDRDISAGTKWEKEIDKHLNEANIILLLVSPDFINSDYCYGVEMQRALERDKSGEARVIPIILRPVYWQDVLGNLQALPTDAKPVMSSNWQYQDEAFFNIIEGIRKAIEPLTIQPLRDNLKTSQDANEIRLAIANESFSNYFELAKAIFRYMRITAFTLIESLFHENGTVWEVRLPSFGLRVNILTAVLLLRQKPLDQIATNDLVNLASEREADFIIVLDITNVPRPPIPIPYPKMFWFRSEDLMEMVLQSDQDLLGWLGRFFIIHGDMRRFFPYQTNGATEQWFVGFENEITRLIYGSHRGGIILGAHRSGKTSILYQIKKRLQEQESQVIGPLIPLPATDSRNYQSLFEKTLYALGLNCPKGMTPQAWAEAIISFGKAKSLPVFLFDEVDGLLDLDARNGFKLGKQMRVLQQNNHCRFYLSGLGRLRREVELDDSPFHHFAEQVILTGLTKKDTKRLIQEPMKLIGFRVSDDQCQRIYLGTCGVPVLIQEFCIRLLNGLFNRANKPEIEDALIEEIENSPEYLHTVFEHFKYGQTSDSMIIMLIIAMHGPITKSAILEEFSRYGVALRRQQLDKHLSFLSKFGILEELASGRYKILSRYLFQAIMVINPAELIKAELEKRKSITFQIDRKRLITELYHTLKTDYIGLLAQHGSGIEVVIDSLMNGPCPIPEMKLISILIPHGVSNSDDFYEIFLSRLIEASRGISAGTQLTDKVLEAVQVHENKTVDFRTLIALETLCTEIDAKYLVIIISNLDEVSEEILRGLLLLLREYHGTRKSELISTGKMRFLTVDGLRLWDRFTEAKPNVSPFNIVEWFFFDGLNHEEIQAIDNKLTLETAVRLQYMTDGVPSLVVQAIEGSLDFDDLVPFFELLFDNWSALPSSSQEALKN